MEKAVVLVLTILFVSIFAAYFLSGMGITGMFIGFGQPMAAEWWNTSWQYRVKLEINSTQYSRTDWPIEHDMNFTDLIPSGTFDDNSTRVIEYDQSGNVLYELPSQFDKGNNYDASTNAVGTLVFLMNGTTNSNSNRTFFVYYDTVENGAKVFPNYDSSELNHSCGGQKLTVNNTYVRLFIDTNRGENTSGLYRAEDLYENVIVNALVSKRTVEYLEYFNGSHNLTFNLINNASCTDGVVRVTITQVGDEVIIGEPSQKTNEGNITKKYYIYAITTI